MALGIGANSAVFSLVDAVLLRPLSYAEPERLVWLWEANAAQKLPVVPASPANFADWKEQSRSFEAMGAWRDVNLTLTGREFPERLSGARVLPGLLGILGAKMAHGRGFARGEGMPGAEKVVIVTHGLWQRRFGGAASLVGHAIQLDGTSYTVVGILSDRFQFPFSRVEVLIPWYPAQSDLAERGARSRYLRVIARLKPGVGLEQARSEASVISHRLEEAYPASNRGWGINVMPLRDFFLADFRQGLASLMVAVAFVVLIACVNVANLLLVRATGRRREFAVRIALGAGRGRLFRQLLTENVLLGLAGGTAGLFLAWAGVKPLMALIPEMNIPIPGLDSVGIDWRAAGFTVAVSISAGLIFGLAPLFQAFTDNHRESLKEGERSGTGGKQSRRLRALLVVTEIALAVTLTIGAGLMMRSFGNLQQVDPGYRAESTLTFRLSLAASRYPQPAQQRAFFRQLAERLRTLPSAVAVGLTNYVPLSGSWSLLRFTVDGRPAIPEEMPSASNEVVTPSYFGAMGIKLAAGRLFTDQDDENARRVAIVNESAAKHYWPGASPLGQRLHLEGEGADTPPLEVIGVVRDVRQLELHSEAVPELYRCYFQAPTASMSAVIHTSADPLALAEAARRAVVELDPAQPVYNVETLSSMVHGAMWQTRLAAALFGVFSGLALVLAAIGIYGVTSYAVAQRTREIGIRMALGATPTELLRLVLGGGLKVGLAGVLSGMTVAYSFARAMAGMLRGVDPVDPLTYTVAPLFLLAVVVVANLVPALRAARANPMAALRHE